MDFNGFRIVALMAAAAGSLLAQDDSRLASLAAQQREKAGSLRADQPGRIERGLNWVRDGGVVERVTEGLGGWRLKMGGMAPGSGFAAGPEYHRNDLWAGRLTFRGAVATSTRGYRKFDFDLALPRISGGRFFAELHGVYHNYPGMPFYGPGASSSKTGRTDFRLEDTAIDFTVGVRPMPRLSLGASTGYLLNNIGAGTDGRYASAESVYTPLQAPGIDVQSNYLRTGAFVQYDWRDNPGGPRRGGNYFAQFSQYLNRTSGNGDFQRLEVEAQQYISILNERRVFAVRAKTALSFHDENRAIPFYMLPALGGSEDLRGYRPFRFRGNNLVAMNAEYRWEVFSGLDMALFGDAGKVFERTSRFDLDRLESDLGFGFRFNARNQTFLRLDVAFSHEGYQVWVKFNDVFKKGPVRTSSSMEDF